MSNENDIPTNSNGPAIDLSQMWEFFKRHVINPLANLKFQAEMEKAFYSGAHSVLQRIDQALRDGKTPDEIIAECAELKAEAESKLVEWAAPKPEVGPDDGFDSSVN